VSEICNKKYFLGAKNIFPFKTTKILGCSLYSKQPKKKKTKPSFKLALLYLTYKRCSCLTIRLHESIHTMIPTVVKKNVYTVTYSGVLFTMELYCTPKSQHTTVKHSWQLFEHTYTSNLYSLGTLTPIEFFQQDLLWQSSNTHSHSCSRKASKHTSG
jgi:hypothetical protein